MAEVSVKVIYGDALPILYGSLQRGAGLRSWYVRKVAGLCRIEWVSVALKPVSTAG